MRESEFKRRVLDGVTRCNGMVFHIVASMMQEPGWPDEYIQHRYWRGFLEFKGKNTRLSAKQKIIIRELNERCPGSAYVVRYPDRIENEKGELIVNFDGSGQDLVQKLSGI